ncbi:ATP synthase F1 subunit gamma [bacterium]|nr:ATP synthase F1 subunit gamma [bacterium]
MATLRAIKDRITSIKNTQKITRAMKMVAAAKVKKAENQTKASRPFASELYKIISALLADFEGEFKPIEGARPIENYPELLKDREIDTAGLVVISSNKGLAGAYSSNIVRYTIKRIKEENALGRKVKLFLVGQKAIAPLKSAQKNLDFEIVDVYTKLLDGISATKGLILAEDVVRAYIDGAIDTIELITTRYKNMMTYKVESWDILPLTGEDSKLKKFREEDKEHEKKLHALMQFEPNVETILKKLMPMYFTNIIYQALLEALASELASRMTAMSAAVNNASDMIQTLTIDYNKARQAKITQELTEIISGVNAIK